MPSPPSKTCQLSPNMQDEHKVLPLLDIPMVDDEWCSTATSPPLILSCPDPPPWIFEGCLDQLLVLPDHTFTDCCPTSTHNSDMRQWRNLKDEVKVAGIDEKLTGKIAVIREGEEITEKPPQIFIRCLQHHFCTHSPIWTPVLQFVFPKERTQAIFYHQSTIPIPSHPLSHHALLTSTWQLSVQVHLHFFFHNNNVPPYRLPSVNLKTFMANDYQDHSWTPPWLLLPWLNIRVVCH